jgi:hypothetical protein
LNLRQGDAATVLASASECKDLACVKFPAGGTAAFMRLSDHNFGLYNGLSFSVWYRPDNSAGAFARIFDFGVDGGGNFMALAREWMYNLLFTRYVRMSAVPDVKNVFYDQMWDGNIWRHAVWVLAATGTSARWDFYMDGVLLATTADMYYPVDATWNLNYLGKSNWPDGPYVGYMDSFYIFPTALSADQAVLLYQVSATAVYFLPLFSHAVALSLLEVLNQTTTWQHTGTCMHVQVCRKSQSDSLT